MFYKLEHLLEQLIKMKFPNMKGLEVNCSDPAITTITFENTGEYSQNEVEDYLEHLKKECSKPIDLSMVKDLKIKKTDFGINMSSGLL